MEFTTRISDRWDDEFPSSRTISIRCMTLVESIPLCFKEELRWLLIVKAGETIKSHEDGEDRISPIRT